MRIAVSFCCNTTFLIPYYTIFTNERLSKVPLQKQFWLILKTIEKAGSKTQKTFVEPFLFPILGLQIGFFHGSLLPEHYNGYVCGYNNELHISLSLRRSTKKKFAMLYYHSTVQQRDARYCIIGQQYNKEMRNAVSSVNSITKRDALLYSHSTVQ